MRSPPGILDRSNIRPSRRRRRTPQYQRFPCHAFFNGSGLMRTYLVVLAIEA
jgi:hypothetical protein